MDHTMHCRHVQVLGRIPSVLRKSLRHGGGAAKRPRLPQPAPRLAKPVMHRTAARTPPRASSTATLIRPPASPSGVAGSPSANARNCWPPGTPGSAAAGDRACCQHLCNIRTVSREILCTACMGRMACHGSLHSHGMTTQVSGQHAGTSKAWTESFNSVQSLRSKRPMSHAGVGCKGLRNNQRAPLGAQQHGTSLRAPRPHANPMHSAGRPAPARAANALHGVQALIYYVPSSIAPLHALARSIPASGALLEGAGHMEQAPNMPAWDVQEQLLHNFLGHF